MRQPLSAELVRTNVDILVAQGHAVIGAKAEATSVPIVFIYSGDPVGAGIVPNLGRPGGNLTGVTLQAVDRAGKRIELLGDAAPRVSRLAAFVNPLQPSEDTEFQASRLAAQRFGLALQQFPVRSVGEVNAALETIARDRVDGVVAFSSALIMSLRNGMAALAVKHRIPTVSVGKTSRSTAISGPAVPTFKTVGGTSPSTSTRFCRERSPPISRWSDRGSPNW